MKAKIEALKTENENLLAAARAQGRELTKVEALQFDSNLANLKALKRQEELDSPSVFVGNGNGTNIPGPSFGGSSTGQGAASRLTPGAGKRYGDLFGRTDGGGFVSFGDFLTALSQAPQLYDPRLRLRAGGQNEGIPSDGGFFVPTEYAAKILDAALEGEVVRPRAQIWGMKSETLKVPGLDAKTHANQTLFGGITSQWSAPENTDQSVQTAKTRLVQLTAHKNFILSQISNELLADSDSVGFEAYFSSSLIAGMRWFMDFSFLQGNGAGKPLGALKDPALIVVPKQSGQASATIVYENVAGMIGKLHPACFANSVWVVHVSALPQLLQMQLVVKNVAGTENVGGSAVPIFSTENFTMLTRPVILTEKLPVLGSQGDVLLADFSQYAVGLRRDVTLEKSPQAGFTSDSTFYRSIVRVDGQGTWSGPLTLADGTTTVSWAVTLQAR